MWKTPLLALLSLAACDGINSNNTATVDLTYAPLSVGSAASRDKTYVAGGPTMIKLNGYDAVADRQATIEVVSATQINVNGVPLMADADGTTFRSADGSYVMEVASSLEGVTTDQILYMLASEELNGESRVTPYVMGNATAAGDRPTSGTAVYTGQMTLINDLGQKSAVDGLVLTISLDTGGVSGGFTLANTYDVALAPTKLSDGSFFTTLASAEASPVVTGTIDGTMFGAKGEEVAGTVGLEYSPNGTPTESYVGYYGTATTP